jgi:hypothetical protein
MVSIMCEPNGTPIINANGNLTFLAGKKEFRQRIFNLFNTQVGSEEFYPEYGFDLISAESLPPTNRDQLLQILVVNALNVDQIQDLYGIRSVESTFTGTTGVINIELTDVNGNEYSETYDYEL